jgi:hypothetical protein
VPYTTLIRLLFSGPENLSPVLLLEVILHGFKPDCRLELTSRISTRLLRRLLHTYVTRVNNSGIVSAFVAKLVEIAKTVKHFTHEVLRQARREGSIRFDDR